jgi:hypothetical protein
VAFWANLAILRPPLSGRKTEWVQAVTAAGAGRDPSRPEIAVGWLAMANALETVTMPIGYFRLIHRGFGERFGDAALAGTGVSLQQLENPATEINLAQQVRQIELISALYGADWVFERPEIWNAAMHGAIAVAAISAPTLGDVGRRAPGAREKRYCSTGS